MATRTTVTLDDDVLRETKAFSTRREIPFREALNQLVRAGLMNETNPKSVPPFQVKPFTTALRPDLNYDDIEGLIEFLEGPEHR